MKQGFLLTRHCYDHNNETHIEFWLSTDDGPVKLLVTAHESVFFVEQTDLSAIEKCFNSANLSYKFHLLNLKTFQQKKIAGLYFKNLKNFYNARSILSHAKISFYEANFRLTERFLMERFIHAGVTFIGDEKHYENFVEYNNVKIKPSDYSPKLRTLSIDIECSIEGELYSIGFYSNDQQKEFCRVIMIGQEVVIEQSQQYIYWVNDETTLLHALEKTIQQYDPDIIIGWNVINFDFRLLFKRAERYGFQLKLGRDKSHLRWRDSRTEKNQGYIGISGRIVIDGIAALKAESYFFPSFSLEAMAQHFLGIGKSVDNVNNRLDEINHNFKYNQPQLAAYNLQDCILVWNIFEKAKLLDFLIFRSQLTGLEMDRNGGSVAAFTNLYLPQLHRRGYVSPNLPEGGGLASPGGYVMDSKPGLYQQVLVLDFKSLYPSIIRTFKIDPLGLIEGEKSPENAIKGFRGAYFSREDHLLPDIITELWKQRDQAKKNNDSARSQAIKILMNSFYGVLGSGGCPFYDTKLASSITLRGHAIMQQTAIWIEAKGLQVIYGDTDSTFVLLKETTSDEEAVSIGQALAEDINNQWQLKLAKNYNLECYLEIEFESHFSRFLMPTIRGSDKGSKKRYAGLLKKGKEQKIIFKGLENVRTDWTELAKNFQKKLYELLFNDEDPTNYILEVVQQTLNGDKDEELVYRKRLRRLLSSYIKNIPPHVKAARLADAENLKCNKPLKYQNKGWISYVITITGPQPIEYISANIDYQHYVDKQIKPVAEAILPFVGLSFEQIIQAQMGLF